MDSLKCQEFSIQSMTGGKKCCRGIQKIPECKKAKLSDTQRNAEHFLRHKNCFAIFHGTRNFSVHAQEPPESQTHSNIPPVCDWRFLTKLLLAIGALGIIGSGAHEEAYIRPHDAEAASPQATTTKAGAIQPAAAKQVAYADSLRRVASARDSSLAELRHSLLEKRINAEIGRNIANHRKFILVDKSDRVLIMYEHGREKYRIPIGIGPSEEPKVKKGDSLTPEGIYYICTINKGSEFRRFYGISYPNLDDAYRGLGAKLITRSQFDSIAYAVSRKKQPLWNTALGGEVGIHGPLKIEDKSNGRKDYIGSSADWTKGCIATDREYINKLSKDIKHGVPVIIRR